MSKLVRFDWAIKNLLRDKANFDILEGFLGAVIGEDIQVQELLESYGTSKLIVQYMEKGKPYSDIKKVISVSIAYFSVGKGEDYVYHGSTNFVGMKKRDQLELTKTQKKLYGKSDVSGLFPEYYLLRVEKFDDHVSNDLDQWAYMLKHDDVEPDFHAKHIQEAGERLQYMSLNKKTRQVYDRYLENLRYRASMEESVLVEVEQEGFEKGMEKGMEKGQSVIIRNALATGMTISQLVEITGLSEDQINQLKDGG